MKKSLAIVCVLIMLLALLTGCSSFVKGFKEAYNQEKNNNRDLEGSIAHTFFDLSFEYDSTIWEDKTTDSEKAKNEIKFQSKKEKVVFALWESDMTNISLNQFDLMAYGKDCRFSEYDDSNFVESNAVNIDGVQAFVDRIEDQKENLNIVYYVFIYKNSLYEFIYKTYNSLNENTANLDALLSTFHFDDPSLQSDKFWVGEWSLDDDSLSLSLNDDSTIEMKTAPKTIINGTYRVSKQSWLGQGYLDDGIEITAHFESTDNDITFILIKSWKGVGLSDMEYDEDGNYIGSKTTLFTCEEPDEYYYLSESAWIGYNGEPTKKIIKLQ